ncbi:MAG: DMT family transporter [Cytophagaceae bacterium]|nr:DMT family transporter [Cytophagaceae bacterium]MDW8456337.1 DMT family transporter [Cytophagaceae bacterium]
MRKKGLLKAEWKGLIYVLIGAICFSTKAILVKFTYRYGIDAITSLCLRMLFAFPFYTAMLWYSCNKAKLREVSAKQWSLVLCMGIVGYYMASMFDFAGLKYISASLERLIVFLYPTLVVIISAFFLSKKIKRNVWWAMFISYLGIVIVFSGDTYQQQGNLWLGVFLVFMSSFTYAIYLIGTGELVHKLGTLFYTSLAMLISCVIVFIHFFVFHDFSLLFSLPKVLYVYGFLMGVLATVVPSFFISEGIKLLGSSKASVVSSIGPVFTILLAIVFLNETFSLIHALGTLLVIAGVVKVSRG